MARLRKNVSAMRNIFLHTRQGLTPFVRCDCKQPPGRNLLGESNFQSCYAKRKIFHGEIYQLSIILIFAPRLHHTLASFGYQLALAHGMCNLFKALFSFQSGPRACTRGIFLIARLQKSVSQASWISHYEFESRISDD